MTAADHDLALLRHVPQPLPSPPGALCALNPLRAGVNGPGKGLSAIEGVAFICINAQGHIQVASPEAHSLLGYAKNELKGRVSRDGW